MLKLTDLVTPWWKTLLKFSVILLSLLPAIHSTPFDDGKYSPKKYQFTDDGRYYRPLNEGKYVRGDEGKYTYVYKQGLYPEDDGDYRYIHQVGPNGGFGGNGGNGGYGGNGGFGPDGGYGGNGRFGGYGGNGNDRYGDESREDSSYKPNKIKYIGHKIYAERYPYIHKIIKALVEQYVSQDYINFGEESQGSAAHYKNVQADNEVAVKCHYLTPNTTASEFVTQYPPHLNVGVGEKPGSYYSFKGTKVLSTVANALNNKLKLEYEVFVRIFDDVTD